MSSNYEKVKSALEILNKAKIKESKENDDSRSICDNVPDGRLQKDESSNCRESSSVQSEKSQIMETVHIKEKALKEEDLKEPKDSTESQNDSTESTSEDNAPEIDEDGNPVGGNETAVEADKNSSYKGYDNHTATSFVGCLLDSIYKHVSKIIDDEAANLASQLKASTPTPKAQDASDSTEQPLNLNEPQKKEEEETPAETEK